MFKQLQLRKREEEMIGIQNRIMAMQYIKKNFKGKKKSSIKLAIILSYNYDKCDHDSSQFFWGVIRIRFLRGNCTCTNVMKMCWVVVVYNILAVCDPISIKAQPDDIPRIWFCQFKLIGFFYLRARTTTDDDALLLLLTIALLSAAKISEEGAAVNSISSQLKIYGAVTSITKRGFYLQ